MARNDEDEGLFHETRDQWLSSGDKKIFIKIMIVMWQEGGYHVLWTFWRGHILFCGVGGRQWD